MYRLHDPAIINQFARDFGHWPLEGVQFDGGREGAASAGAAGRFIRVASVGRHRSIIGVDLMMFQCRHGSAPGFGGFVFGSNLVGVFK